MSWKSLITCIMLLMNFAFQSTANAYGAFWYDKNMEITSLGKAMIFPWSWAHAPYEYITSNVESSYEYRVNDYLYQQFSKKIKKLKFYPMAPGLAELRDISGERYDGLLVPFSTEQDRAKAVSNETAADMYLVPQAREHRVQKDISPRREFDVTLKSWTTIYNSPNHYHQTYTKDEKKRRVHHVIPQTPVYLNVMVLQIAGYDEKGNKILTFVDGRREYNRGLESEYKDIIKYFRKDFGDVKSGKKFQPKGKPGEISIGFKNIDLPQNVGNDEYLLKAAFFAMKDEAFKCLKDVNIKYDSKSSDESTYYIDGSITDCKLISTWHEPSYRVSDYLVRSEESKWKDKDGKEHKQKTYYYDQKINNILAHWSFSWGVVAKLRLVNAKTNNVVISKLYSNYNDKYMDCYRNIFKNFYNDVNKQLKKI